MVCVHWALSEAVGLSWAAAWPLCTGAVTTAAVPASQVQPASVPVSKPGLLTRLPPLVGVGVAGVVGVGVAGTGVGVAGIGVGVAAMGVGGGGTGVAVTGTSVA